MKFLDLNSDVLAIKCTKNNILVGIGCTLYVINKLDYKIKFKKDILHPDNIHNIIVKSDNVIIVYGGKSLAILHIDATDDLVIIENIGKIHYFNDWIINVKCLGSSNNVILTILFAHNNVYNYDINTKQYASVCCKETCLLYAGALYGVNHNDVTILSGTVFQEILIWKFENHCNSKFAQVLFRLKGHKGVIFSVFYNQQDNLICSTSDDRTIRLWKVSDDLLINRKATEWKNINISLQTTMYGHLARVWKAIMLNNIIASIGEDSRICFWNMSGELLYKIEAHNGVPIWCIDMSEDDIIFTGGADGSVNCWSLANILNNEMHKYTLFESSKDVIPKYVTFLDNGDVLNYINSSDSSQLLHYNRHEYKLLTSYELPKYCSTYCITEISLDKKCIALASIEGEITLYKKAENSWNHTGNYKIFDSKILSMQWLNSDLVLVCKEEGILCIVKFTSGNFEVLSQHVLPSSRERWVTSACIYNNLLVCGDRMGSIFIYSLKSNIKDPIQAFKKIHGRLGVQSCTIVDSKLITTGRDGFVRFYKFNIVNSDKVEIEYLYAKSMPMDWVSRFLINQDGYFVLGFKEEDFVIYCTVLKRILLKIPCGGGHRSWDVIMKEKLFKFVYIQKRQVNVVSVPLNTLFVRPLLISCHKKEIYFVKSLPMSSTSDNIIISGGEDCILHINLINSLISELELNFKTVDSFTGHLSSIKCASIFVLSIDEKYLLFSGGGRAQLKIWEICLKLNENNVTHKSISCKDLLSYMLHGPDKQRNKIWNGKEFMYNVDPETRYMDISTIRNPYSLCSIYIFIACSDGYLRTLNYNYEINQLTLINVLDYKNRCILKIHSFMYTNIILLITMATDGFLNFWKFSVTDNEVLIENLLINEKHGYRLHQSGINSFDIKALNEHEYILATGGDDNLLSLLVFKIIDLKDEVLTVQIINLWQSASAHYAQITGLNLLDNKLYSVGADQKLVIHNYTYCDSKINSVLVEESNVCIPDIQGITFFKRIKCEKELFCIYGKGFQLLQN